MAYLTKKELEELIKKPEADVCVSIYFPTHRKGDEILEDPIRLKNLLAQAEDELEEMGHPKEKIREIIEPALSLLERHAYWQHQSDGLALFLSTGFTRDYRLPVGFDEMLVVAGRFHIKPLIPLLTGNGRFYVLAISQNEIRLIEGTRDNVGEIKLEDVPTSLAEALRWEDPEKQLQWHTSTQNQAGLRPAMFHGHGESTPAGDDETFIKQYFHQVDEGLRDFLDGETPPLILAGVEYLFPLYKEANSYPNLIDEGIPGNPEQLSAKDLHRKAWEIVSPRFREYKQEAFERFKSMAGSESEKASHDLREIVPAAYFERIETLFVSLDHQQWGTFDPKVDEIRIHQKRKPHDEDLLDFAATHTLMNGGSVYAVSHDEIPGGSPIAAIFRY